MTTGKHSLNSRIRGEIRALCEQSSEKITPEKMYHRIKQIAVEENGLPAEEKRIKIKKEGKIKVVKYLEPISLAGESTENGMIVQMTIQEISDAYELYLYEYVSDLSDEIYRSVGGRTPAEMVKYIEDLEKSGDMEKAAKLKAPIKANEKTAEDIVKKTFGGKEVKQLEIF
jgi:hypothetical protein